MARAKTEIPYDAIVGDTLKNLIKQFSQELCFYRELIQNAIDAGSHRVDVEIAYLEKKKMAVARIVDYGEGMDRQIIDTQLTRLFSSTKEGDFTKIGKFGIGFVSVFAVQPAAVVVDTGRGGEHWRVLFHPDCSFERIRLDDPVEGTRVEVYKQMNKQGFSSFLKRSRETIAHWCRHTPAEIFVNGEQVNEPFDLPGPVSLKREEHGTAIVAALTRDSNPFFGFYNQGITLLEGRKAYFPGVTFKIKSRYLEHTLTRDNVKQDANYDKALGILTRIARQDLMLALFEHLEAAAQDPENEQNSLLWDFANTHMDVHWPRIGRNFRIVPTRHGAAGLRFVDLAGTASKGGALLKTLGAPNVPTLFFDTCDNPVTEALHAQGIPVLRAQPASQAGKQIAAQGFKLRQASSVLAAPPAVAAENVPQGLSRLGRDTITLLDRCGLAFSGVGFATFDYALSSVSYQAFILQNKPGPLAIGGHQSALPEDGMPAIWPLKFLNKRHLVLNVSHPLVNRLARMGETHGDTAAFMLAKLVCLADGLNPKMEERLQSRAASV